MTLTNKLAAATGSRELDAEIFKFVYDCSDIVFTGPPPEYPEVAYAPKEGGQLQDIPRYSTSIDAALTLVPDSLTWEIHPSYVVVSKAVHGRYETIAEGNSLVSAAIAICIAALKVRGIE